MPIQESEIRKLITESLPDATVEIKDLMEIIIITQQS